MSFIYGGTTGQTAESIQRKRELARKMLDGVTSSQPKNVWEGIRAVGTALGSRVALNKADKQWQAGVDDANKQFAGLFAPRDVRQSFAPETGTMAPQMSEGSAPAPQSYVNGRVAQAHGDPDLASGIAETASALGIDPVDLATAISYETAGTFDPAKEGPTTQWGKHRGLIQFGEPQAQKYGVNWDDPAGSQLGAEGAIAKYLTDAGVKPGMGLMDVYSAINAGSVGRYGASDANNGGAPGTVADKVSQQMAGHRQKAEQFMGFMPQQQPQQAIDAVAPQQAPQRAGIDPVLIQALSNPFLNKEQRAVIAGMVQQQMAAQAPVDPLKQLKMEQIRRDLETNGRPWWAGENGSVDPAKLAELQARANKTTVNVNGEPADTNLRKELDKNTGELWSTYQEQAANSSGTMQDMQMLDEIIKLAPQGPLEGRLAETFPGFSAAGDAFQSIVKRVAPTLRAPGSGSTSDIEYDGMLRSLPALRNKPEANNAIAGMMKAKAAINMERGAIVNDYSTGAISAADARRRMGELDQRSIMTPELKALIGGLAPSAPPSGVPAPDGVDADIWDSMTPEERALWQN